RRHGSLFFEKIGKMGDLFKAEAVGDFRDVPVCLFQEDLGFLDHTAADDLGGGFAGVFFQDFVEVVDVNGESFGVFPGGPQGQRLVGRFDGKLPFQQFDEQGND